MSRTKLVELSGVSKQQLSRLESGQIRLRLDHLQPFAAPLGYTPEQILLWGRFPGTGTGSDQGAAGERGRKEAPQSGSKASLDFVPELDPRSEADGRPSGGEVRKEGRHADSLKSERWVFPASFVREQLHTSASRLVVLEANGDSMVPTIMAGDRVIIDIGHKTPTPDGLYAIRDTFEGIVVKRLQLLRSARPTRVKIISDNPKNATEEAPLSELEIVGKVLCGLKFF